MSRTQPPRILLADLDPIFELGIARALMACGAEILDRTWANPDGLVRSAAECRPDLVVLGGNGAGGGDVGRLRAAVPDATLVLWRKDADAVAVMRPGAASPRLMPAPAAEELCQELLGGESREGEACRPT